MPKHPTLPAVSRGNRPAQLLERAALALRTQHFGEAEQLAADVLRTSRTDTAATMILAQALIAQNRAAEAIAPLEKAARRSSDARIETLLGAGLGSAGRGAERSNNCAGPSRGARPSCRPSRNSLASFQGRTRRGGIAVAESGLALTPESVDLQLDLARLHLYRNERGRARAMLSNAREAAPGRPDILTEFARVLLLDGEYAAAAAAFRHALGLRPDDVLTRADLAACLLEMGDRDAGEANLRSAALGRPQMFGRATHALAASSHGRFFFRPSALAKFLQGDRSEPSKP